MKKINVLLVTLRADYGGGPRHVDFIIQNISLPYNLYVACPKDKPYYDHWLENEQVSGVLTLPHRQFKISELFKLIAFCKENQIQIIHSHGKGAGVYTRLVKIFLPAIKVIHTFHGIHIAEYKILKKNIYFIYEKLASCFTDHFINVSFGEKEICLKHKFFTPPKSTVIFNAIRELPQPEKLVDFNPNDKFIITTISRFDISKNMFLNYELAKSLREYDQIMFLWVGDGEDKHKLEQMARQDNLNNIFFTGFKENIGDYLALTHVYLSTSRWEGLPYSLLEASSLAIPIVATDVVGNNEIVRHGINGYLFPMDQVMVATKYLIQMASDKALRLELGRQALKIFHENFHIDKMIQDLEVVYSKEIRKERLRND